MITVIKCLSLLLVGFLAYDTLNFVFVTSKSQTQMEVRPETKVSEIPVEDIPDVTTDDEMYSGVLLFFFVAGIAGLVMYYSKMTRKHENHHVDAGPLALRRVPEEPYMRYFYDVGGDFSRDDARVLNKFSEIQLTLAPNPPSEDDKPASEACTEPLYISNENRQLQQRGFRRCQEMEGDIIDINLLSSPAHERHVTLENRDVLMATQTDSSLACDCNMEQFEERLGAVEHGLKTSSEATKEWSKRIEQAEVDLVNLHRQMYTILSKAEFVAPSSELFSKAAGESTPLDFYEPTLYKVPDIIVETKKEFEQGDLFRKSLTQQSAEDNWSALMEEDLTDRIKELTVSNSQLYQQSASTATTDPIKIKESLMKKNEELKEKTRTIVKAMEEAVRTTNARKNKLGVHSHYVQPYRRIQHADTDSYIVNAKSKLR